MCGQFLATAARSPGGDHEGTQKTNRRSHVLRRLARSLLFSHVANHPDDSRMQTRVLPKDLVGSLQRAFAQGESGAGNAP